MHPVVLIRFILYFVAIILHSALAIIVAIQTHKGLLQNFGGNHAAIIIGAIWTVVLTFLITCDLTRSRTPGSEDRERRWIVGTWNELNILFQLMFWELLSCGLNTYRDFTNFKCEDDPVLGPNPCPFRTLIFGVWWSAAATVTLYFCFLVVFGFVVVVDFDSQTTVRDYYDFPGTRGEAYIGSKAGTAVGLSDFEGVSRSFKAYAKDSERACPPIKIPQAAR